jgi:hypothetical protein
MSYLCCAFSLSPAKWACLIRSVFLTMGCLIREMLISLSLKIFYMVDASPTCMVGGGLFFVGVGEACWYSPGRRAGYAPFGTAVCGAVWW